MFLVAYGMIIVCIIGSLWVLIGRVIVRLSFLLVACLFSVLFLLSPSSLSLSLSPLFSQSLA